MTPADAETAAQRYFDIKRADIDVWLDTATHVLSQDTSQARRKNAAFQLHQAVEAAYICFLLVRTFYFPRSHNIKFLRSLAEDVDKRLVAAWPREHRLDRRRFETLKRAYVEARYSDQYDVSPEDLTAIAGSTTRLRDLVAEACQDRIDTLQTAAAGS